MNVVLAPKFFEVSLPRKFVSFLTTGLRRAKVLYDGSALGAP